MEEKKVVTRFAPSPTGFLHVGGVRTALYAYLFARKHNGRFILRIEDTDKEREVAGSIPHIIESLRWLSITWDEGVDIGGPHEPYLQSKRLESYQKYARILIEKGLAYPDPYSQEEVSSFRQKADEAKKPFLFREYRPEVFEVWDGTKPLRFKVPEIKETHWHDAVRGDLRAGEEALDDFILIKADGYPTYNFAHIIDDYEMGVTHIMRADEFIASTPKFISLYEALGFTPPVLVTLPPILGKDGNKKLGKRDGAKDILDYREEGYLPEAMVNFLALLGWNPGGEKELLSMEELIETFTIEKIHSAGAMFDEKKLLWMNKEYTKLLPKEKGLPILKKFLPEYEAVLNDIYATVIDRVSTFAEARGIEKDEFRFFIEEPMLQKEMLLWKDDEPGVTVQHLSKVLSLVEEGLYASIDDVKALLMPYAEEVGKGSVLWPLRVSLSGKEKSVDPFTLLYVLGKEKSIRRIREAIKMLSS